MKLDGVTVRRTYMEVPTMDERKWAKIPEISADVFMADLEDSVPPALKDEARRKVIDLVRDPSYFGGREFVCRPNNLETSWGREDLAALAEAHAPFVLYPKARSADEVREVLAIFAQHDASPELMVIVETPQAVLRLDELASIPGVNGLMFGPGDLSLETGIALLNEGEAFTEGFLYPRSKTLIAARAHGLEAVEGLFVGNLKDMESVEREAQRSKLFGFTGCITFYPPHVPIINKALTPGDTEIAWSQRVVEAYEEARARGEGAVTVDGRWVTVHQFTEAERALRVASALGLVPGA